MTTKNMRDHLDQSETTGLPARVMVLGGTRGMLGPALAQQLKTAGCEVLPIEPCQGESWNADGFCRQLERHEPDLVIYTLCTSSLEQVDQEPSRAFYWNKELPCFVARALNRFGLGLVTFSSDCVFDGRQQVPYTVNDEPHPTSVQGESFLAGERALQECGLRSLLIIRSSWLFGPFGPNFVDWVMQKGQQCRYLQVTHDEIGSPTYSMDLASYALRLMACKVTGVHHVCNSGQASWCELAAETLNACGLNCKVQAVTENAGHLQCQRPAFSVLDSRQSLALAKTKARPWPHALRDYIFTFHSQQVQGEELGR
ncbi:MAG: NAD(P)-dependent oxidoreductase [Desulfovermiculus sp.]